LAAVLVLSVAACTAAPTNTATTNAATTGAAEPNPASTEQPSAILVQPIHDAQVVPGDDRKDHVEYELMVVNVYFEPATLTSMTVLDSAGKELGRMTEIRSPPRPRRC
jgi:hypothetical protein